MKRLIFCFDIDNTICKTIGSNYTKSKPIKKNIILINQLYNSGHHIKIFTSRYMGRYNSNIKMVKKQGYKKTFNQLTKWGLKFNSLIMGKPRYDYFIDDKNFDFNKNWVKKIKSKFL